MPNIEATMVGESPLGKCPECGEWCSLDEVVGRLHYFELEHCGFRWALMPKFSYQEKK